jgi:hypothetical protein
VLKNFLRLWSGCKSSNGSPAFLTRKRICLFIDLFDDGIGLFVFFENVANLSRMSQDSAVIFSPWDLRYFRYSSRLVKNSGVTRVA